MAGKIITALTAASGGELATTSLLAGMASGGTEARKFTIAQISSIIGLAVTAGKTLTSSNSLTLAGTDGSTLNVGTGGTLGTGALKNTGTSGNTIPLLDGDNTHSGQDTFAIGTITTSKPISITQTWNAGGVTFTGFLIDLTSTASAAASLAINAKVAGASVFSVDKSGVVSAGTQFKVAATNTTIDTNIKAGGNFTVAVDAGGLYLGAANDTPLLRGAAGVFKVGSAASFSANATTATVLGSLGPAGANTTVQEWFTIQNSSGVTRYIPAF